MPQGLSLLKEHHVEDTARRFQEAGISALVYDHRGYGSVGGHPATRATRSSRPRTSTTRSARL
jgi:alpha-beta hydrolase superfamily lysophospholipase